MKAFTQSLIRYSLLILTAIGLPVLNGNSQCIFSCADTNYGDDSEDNFFRSKFHLIQTFGEVSFKQTNFFEDNYNGIVRWGESRIFFPRFSFFLDRSKVLFPLPDPYLTGLLKGQKGLNWEDRFDYGLGLEWRPFANFDFSDNSILRLLYHLRVYSVYLRTKFLQPEPGWEWRPTNDLRVGLELYRECNLYNGGENKFWSELWSDFSWRKTNFVVTDFDTWTFAIVPKLGVKLFPDKFTIMPYVTGEISLTGRCTEFWQNRFLIGFGIRTMPFKSMKGLGGIFLRGIRFYAEGNRAVEYFKNDPPPGTPNYDIRVGVTYVINRW